LAKRARVYKGEKRSKELVRQKKQEEKRLRRIHKVLEGETETEGSTPKEEDKEQKE
jgi:hypothetical protein